MSYQNWIGKCLIENNFEIAPKKKNYYFTRSEKLDQGTHGSLKSLNMKKPKSFNKCSIRMHKNDSHHTK